MAEQTEQQARQKVWDLIKDIKVAMMATLDSEGRMHACPMVAVSKASSAEELWFFTSVDSSKVEDITRNPQVLLTYAEPSDQNYVSVAGRAQVLHDRAKVAELWNEHLRTWFPKGKDDPDIALIRVKSESAEYWDAPSSLIVYAYGYVKARLTGEPPQVGEKRVVAM